MYTKLLEFTVTTDNKLDFTEAEVTSSKPEPTYDKPNYKTQPEANSLKPILMEGTNCQDHHW